MDLGSISGILSKGLGSILSGGALGVFGAIGSGYLEYKKTQEANKHQLAVISAQKDLALAQGQNTVLLETIKLMGASYENDKEAYTSTKLFSVDGYRGTLRPNITYLLVGLAIFLAVWAFRRVGLEVEVVKEIARYAVYTCLDLSALCVSWYFGSRQIDKINRRK